MKKLLFIVSTLLLLLVCGCNEPEIEPYKPPKPKSYKYEVVGSSNSFSITIQNANDDTQQWSNVSSGWTTNREQVAVHISTKQ